MRRTLTTLCILWLTTGAAALAFEGRLLLLVTSYPTTIVAPGHYVLVNNPAVPPGTPLVLDIVANDVTLDLNGHTINEPGTIGTLVRVSGLNVVIRGGRLAGGAIGIDANVPNGALQVHRVHFSDQGTAGVQIANASVAEVIGSRVERPNSTGSPTGGGILIGNALVGRVRGNTVLDARQTAIGVGALSVEARDNLIERMDASGDGLVVNPSAAIVAGNAIKGLKAGSGIRIGGGSTIIKFNDVRSVSTTGIDVYGDVHRIVQNVVSQVGVPGVGGGDGIVVHNARSMVRDNLSEDNAGCGLVFPLSAVDNGYAGNMLRNNLGACVLGVQDLGTNDTNAGGNL